jgi:hypothetical protein
MSRIVLVLVCAIALAVVTALLVLPHRTEVVRTSSPSRHFYAVTTTSSWRQFVSGMSGQPREGQCLVEIFRSDGSSMGELSVDKLQDAAIEWTPDGARIKRVGGWHFKKHLCWRWNKEHTNYTYVRGFEP